MKTIFTTIIALTLFTFTFCKKESAKEATTEEDVVETEAPVDEETATFEPFQVMAISYTVKIMKYKKKCLPNTKVQVQKVV